MVATRPTCAIPGCDHPCAKRYDRIGPAGSPLYRRWCDRHTRRIARHKTHRRGRPPIMQPPTTPDARACPVPGCRRLRELRGYRPVTTPSGVVTVPHYRWTCQAHRGAVPNRVTPPPPEPKPRTPWKPDPHAHVVPAPAPAPVPKVKTRPRRPAPVVIPAPAAVITTANDGTWPLTREDLRFLLQNQHRPAFALSTDPALSRPLPTSVVYRVWGMAERGELALEDHT